MPKRVPSRYGETFAKAREMDKNRLAASQIRIRFLAPMLEGFNGDILDQLIAMECLEEIIYLMERAPIDIVQTKMGERLTEEEITQAKQYPIDQIVPFVNGKAYAWCHEDKTPSLTWNKKHNTAYCFPCAKSYSPIKVLMERDKYDFRSAVRSLQ